MNLPNHDGRESLQSLQGDLRSGRFAKSEDPNNFFLRGVNAAHGGFLEQIAYQHGVGDTSKECIRRMGRCSRLGDLNGVRIRAFWKRFPLCDWFEPSIKGRFALG